jgi:hypothetical protein
MRGIVVRRGFRLGEVEVAAVERDLSLASSPFVARSRRPRSLPKLRATVDVVTLTDAIEHMSRTSGFEALRLAARIIRDRVHLFTPDGFMPHHVCTNDDDEASSVPSLFVPAAAASRRNPSATGPRSRNARSAPDVVAPLETGFVSGRRSARR